MPIKIMGLDTHEIAFNPEKGQRFSSSVLTEGQTAQLPLKVVCNENGVEVKVKSLMDFAKKENFSVLCFSFKGKAIGMPKNDTEKVFSAKYNPSKLDGLTKDSKVESFVISSNLFLDTGKKLEDTTDVSVNHGKIYLIISDITFISEPSEVK